MYWDEEWLKRVEVEEPAPDGILAQLNKYFNKVEGVENED